VDLRLQDDVAVVVGGAQGIGRAIALAFREEGARVIVADRDPSVTSLEPEELHGFVADVTDHSAIQNLADTIWAEHGRCDHIVYAAGMGSGKFGFPFWNLDPSDWPRVLNVNLLGAAHTAHAFAPRMAEAGRGTFLFLSSVAGQIGSQTDPPYSAAKAGLINFAQCAAKDLAPYGVRVNTICPGMVKTALNQSVWASWNAVQAEENRMTYEEWAASKIATVTPLKRWQEPEDMAALAVFLASDQAKNITGQTLNIDGGQVMHW
jgi:NAD(P)-dependent dehydrogenase (short-subunit alcohol dehydrogenase family)